MLYKVFYAFIMPPGCIISLLFLFNIYLYRKKIRGYFILTGIIFLLYMLSMQFTAFYLIKPLENMYVNCNIERLKAQNPDVIIMLGGGAISNITDIDGDGQVSGYVANRMITVLRLQKQLELPLILSGGKVFEDTGREADIEQRIFKSMGINEDKMLLDNQSRNTVENARNSKVIMQHHNFTRPILVTSGFHMPRSMMIFEREGVSPVPYVTDYQISGNLVWSIFNFIPNNEAFNKSCIAIREYMGIFALKLNLQ